MAVEKTKETIARIELEDAKQYKSESLWSKAIRRLSTDYLTLLAGSVILVFAILAVTAPLIESALGVDYATADAMNNFLPPGTGNHILGTDDLGRDQLARLFYGGQVSLGIAFFAAILSLSIGLTLGMITGYYGGIVDDFFIWIITTLNSIPSLFLLLIISALLSPSPLTLILILGLLGWTGMLRLVRGETFSLREREFVVAARAMGASDMRIMFMHILPNLLSLVIISLALDIGSLILTESGLSFLNFGVQQPTPSWGNMLTDAQSYYRKAPYLIIWPGIMITVTVLCLYVVGDGIRDAFDPQIND